MSPSGSRIFKVLVEISAWRWFVNRPALLFFVLLSGTLAGPVLAQVPACRPDQVTFMTDSAPVDIQIEVADDEAERAQGLMYRRDLPTQRGMLFIYDSPRAVSFWMRNTLIPLDMIFLDARGMVRHIHENARPLDETPVPGAVVGDPDPERLMVLEIGGGEARRLGIQPGQAMAFPGLDQSIAAQPCR